MENLGFICEICDNTQSYEYGFDAERLRVCDQCKSDLKQLIMAKRFKENPLKDGGEGSCGGTSGGTVVIGRFPDSQ